LGFKFLVGVRVLYLVSQAAKFYILVPLQFI